MPRPLAPTTADRVAVVDHHRGVVALGEVADRRQVGDDPVHREDAVGGDHAVPRAAGLAQAALEVGHVVVGVAIAAGLAEPDAVDDRGVVERVRDDGVLFAEQRLEQAGVGVEAGRVEDRVLRAEEGGEPLLELLVLLLRAADEPHRRHAVAVSLQRVPSPRVDQLGMVGEAEIVVRAEVQHLAAGFGVDHAALGRGDDPLVLEKAVGPDRGKLAGQAFDQAVGHALRSPAPSSYRTPFAAIGQPPSRCNPRPADSSASTARLRAKVNNWLAHSGGAA